MEARTTAERLIALLDYVEQVVRLDERVAFRLADYRLLDGAAVAIRAADVAGLPGIATDGAEGDAPVWLAIDRLARHQPPAPPERLAPWLTPTADPGAAPSVLPELLRTVTAAERSALIAADRAAEEDFAPVPARAEGHEAFDLRLRLADQPGLEAELEDWIATHWEDWAKEEILRRRAIAIYGQVYRLQQILELGGGEGAVEAVMGIGPVRWRREGRSVDRPLIECGVEIELGEDGRLTVRPTAGEPRVDLKPYEEMGCDNLGQLDRLARAEFARTEAEEGLSPFRPDGFEPLLRAAATRFAPNGVYRRDGAPEADPADGPLVTGDWVLYARPRSQHVVLDDIARFRAAAGAGVPPSRLAERLVTSPSDAAPAPWEPLGDGAGRDATAPDGAGYGEVFFPKPFNDDQVAIVRHLAGADGLVVQGPPGTGKTHTIANVICHAMALGQRVLVVSRGEAALGVLRDQLPEKVRPLAIALLSSERQGMRQVEGAIREIQAVVEDSRPEIRHAAIRRCEGEIAKIRDRLAAIDREVDDVAALQSAPLGPAGEWPADLARRVAAERGTHPWFDDAPERYAAEAGLDDAAMARLRDARGAVGPTLDHLDAALPEADDLPSPEVVAASHAALLGAEDLATAAADGPVPGLRLTAGDQDAAARTILALRETAAAAEAVAAQPWLDPLAGALLRGEETGWTALCGSAAMRGGTSRPNGRASRAMPWTSRPASRRTLKRARP